MKTVTVKKGIAYWRDIEKALSVRNAISTEFPNARIVNYNLGWAVQTDFSSDYIGPNLRPSLEAV